MWVDRALLVEYRTDPLQLGFEGGELVLSFEQETTHDVSARGLGLSSQSLSFLSGSDPQPLLGDAPWISTVTHIIAASFLSVASSLHHRSARPRIHAEGFW
jgi:hypothetical protein